MTISLVCPNGHRLAAKKSLAGKTCLCPKCKARVQVPTIKPEPTELPAPRDITESQVCAILGKPEPAPRSIEQASGVVRHDRVASKRTRIKTCPHCNRDVSSDFHLCPHCRTYIAGLADF
jgi:hypothetical protein